MNEYKVGDRYKVNAKFHESHGTTVTVTAPAFQKTYGNHSQTFVPCVTSTGWVADFVSSVLVGLDDEIGLRFCAGAGDACKGHDPA